MLMILSIYIFVCIYVGKYVFVHIIHIWPQGGGLHPTKIDGYVPPM